MCYVLPQVDYLIAIKASKAIPTWEVNPVMSNTVALLGTIKSSWRIARSIQTATVANPQYSEHMQSVHLNMRSEHSVLRFVWSVQCVRIIMVCMLRAVDGWYAPYKPSELLTVGILSTYRACIELWHQGTVCCQCVQSVRSNRNGPYTLLRRTLLVPRYISFISHILK